MADERDQELKASNTPIQIREGAGLEEARYNVEFIEWLRKWSGPLLVIVAVAAGGYALKQHLDKRKKAGVEAAFADFEAARQGRNPNPDSLVAIADQYPDIGAVAILARLEAGDVYLDSVRRGVKPGATVQPDGTLASIEDELKAPDREQLLAKASEQYQWVVDRAGNDPKLAIHAIGSLYGLAAVAESKGDNDGAKSAYEKVIATAEAAKFERHVALAKERIASLGKLAALDPVPTAASVPAPLDTTPKPPPAPAPETPANPVELTPVTPPAGTLTPGATPVPAPQPTPQPAPAENPPANPGSPKR
jgi:hypothetical protein